jgi:phospholipase/carboxylesterase
MNEQRFGSLDCLVAGGIDREGGGAGPVVVLLHGFGAPGDDLASLWRVLDVPREVRFVFPSAPLLVPGYAGGRAWWMIDPESFEHPDRDRSGEVPDGLVEARAAMVAALAAIEGRLAPSTLVLGGFSQGAMLALDVALHDPRPLAGLALLSGTLIAAAEWAPRLPSRRALPVLQSHGMEDPLLPFAQAERLRDQLTGAGLGVEWVPFRGGHEIADRVLERLGAFVTTAAGQ